MARPLKNGLEYFPVDVDLFDDDKIFDLTSEFGPLGEVVYLRVLCLIYRNGYYYKFQSLDKLAALLVKSIGSRWVRDKQSVLQVIPFLAECNLLSSELMQENVLTSVGIQHRYLYATKRRSTSISEYNLLGEGLITAPNSQVTVTETQVIATETKVIADNNAHKGKEIERKVNREENAHTRDPLPAAISGEIGELYKSNISAAPSVADCTAVAAWVATYPAWAIKYAIEQAAQAGKKFPGYIQAILTRIKKDGITDPMQLRKQPSGNGAALRDIAERDYANRHQYTQKDYEAMYTDIFAGSEDDHARE